MTKEKLPYIVIVVFMVLLYVADRIIFNWNDFIALVSYWNRVLFP